MLLSNLQCTCRQQRLPTAAGCELYRDAPDRRFAELAL